MRILNGRLIFEKAIFDDDWTDEESVKNCVGSVILCPATVRELKSRWTWINACGEPYTLETLNQIAEYKDFHFFVPEERMVNDCLWDPTFDLVEHQKLAVIEMLNRKRLAVFFDTGTGKTVIAYQYLYNKLQNRRNKKVLVITKSIVVPQYKHTLDRLPESIRSNNEIVVTSVDKAYQYIGTNFDIAIVDESQLIKNKNTLRFADVSSVITDATPYVFLMTATPQDRTKYETIVQLSILSSKVLAREGTTAFKTRYWILDDYNKPKREIKGRIKEVNETLSQMSITCEADEVLNIPPMDPPIITNCYDGKDMSLYETVADPKGGVITVDGITFAALNDSRRRSFLKQLSNGFIYEGVVKNPDEDIEEWKIKQIPHQINTYKIDAMREQYIRNKFDSTIVYTFFDEDNRLVENMMKSLGLKYRSILRSTQKQRDTMVDEFKSGKVDHLIIKYSSGGAGLDLERCHTIHWFTIPEAWVDLKQGRGRIHRYNQVNRQKEFFYFGSPLDEHIYHLVAKLKKTFTDNAFKEFMKISDLSCKYPK